MSWAYSGQGLTVVPSSYLYFPTYVSNSPFNVTVTCPPDYIQTVSGSTPDCVYLCGNSKRDSTEECDDGNATSGDGWSATWDVENGYVCTGGSSTTVDTCSKFTFVVSSSTPSISTTTSTSSTASTPTPTPATTSSPSKPSVYIISTSNRWVAIIIWTSVLFCLILDIILGIITNSYPASIYVSIEHIQLLAVLPVTGSYFTKIVKGLFRMMRYALLGFDFIDFWSLFKIDTSYSQDNETLEYLGFASESSIVNLVGFIAVAICILVIDTIIHKILLWVWLKWVWPISAFSNTKNWMCISFYIRYLLLGYLLILVSSVNEISNYSVSARKWSWSLTVVILLMWIVFFSIWLIKWLYATNDEEQSSDILYEFVNIVKTDVSSKMSSGQHKIYLTDKKMNPKKFYMLSAEYYKNLDEIILNPTYNTVLPFV